MAEVSPACQQPEHNSGKEMNESPHFIYSWLVAQADKSDGPISPWLHGLCTRRFPHPNLILIERNSSTHQVYYWCWACKHSFVPHAGIYCKANWSEKHWVKSILGGFWTFRRKTSLNFESRLRRFRFHFQLPQWLRAILWINPSAF